MRTANIDNQINTYLGQLNPNEKEVILGVVKTFVENQHDDLLNDKNFVKEMDRRFNEMESGSVKLYTLDEAETLARQSYPNLISALPSAYSPNPAPSATSRQSCPVDRSAG
jgi:hypothetical protein